MAKPAVATNFNPLSGKAQMSNILSIHEKNHCETRVQMSFRKVVVAAIAITVLATSSPANAVEEAKYTVLHKDGNIELRDYSSSIVAETSIESDFESASSKAFRLLFRYIDGENELQSKIAMTAPVAQEQMSRKIAMTAPVSQEETVTGWLVSFMMPSAFTMETIPGPTNPAVRLREQPAYRAAAIRYSGNWSKKNYDRHLAVLVDWLDAQGLQVYRPAVWARYNAPFVPWFLRRNEILIPVEADQHDGDELVGMNTGLQD